MTPSIRLKCGTPYQFIIFLLILILSCSKKTDSSITIKDLGWEESYYAKYISEYSPHIIGSKENVTVRLSNTPTKSIDFTKDANQYLSISPTIAGKASWVGEETILFTPEKRFENNTKYKVEIKLEDLYNNIEKNEESLHLNLMVKPQQLKLDLNEIQYTSEYLNLNMNGKIRCNDEIEFEAIKSTLTARQDGKLLDITWNRNDNKTFDFNIAGIERKAAASKVNLEINGKLLDEKFVGSRAIEVVPKGVFTFLNAKSIGGENGTIELSFSDPISKSQDLNGLITINNQANLVNYEIDNNIVRLYLDGSQNQDININIGSEISSTLGKKLGRSYSKKLIAGSGKPKINAKTRRNNA
jgi:alpha-2-macroglobulin